MELKKATDVNNVRIGGLFRQESLSFLVALALVAKALSTGGKILRV
jgi:hypothetical protein